MLQERLGVLSFAAHVLTISSPAMERTAIDRLLQMSHSQPDSASFRDALVKSLSDDQIKKGTAFDSNGPDFIFAVESPTAPSMIISLGALRDAGGSLFAECEVFLYQSCESHSD